MPAGLACGRALDAPEANAKGAAGFRCLSQTGEHSSRKAARGKRAEGKRGDPYHGQHKALPRHVVHNDPCRFFRHAVSEGRASAAQFAALAWLPHGNANPALGSREAADRASSARSLPPIPGACVTQTACTCPRTERPNALIQQACWYCRSRLYFWRCFVRYFSITETVGQLLCFN